MKKSHVCFFKDSLNKRAVIPTLELDDGNVSTFAKFEYKTIAQKLNESLKKEHNFLFPFYKVRHPSELEDKFILKSISLREKEGLIILILPKDLTHDRPGAGADKQ